MQCRSSKWGCKVCWYIMIGSGILALCARDFIRMGTVAWYFYSYGKSSREAFLYMHFTCTKSHFLPTPENNSFGLLSIWTLVSCSSNFFLFISCDYIKYTSHPWLFWPLKSLFNRPLHWPSLCLFKTLLVSHSFRSIDLSRPLIFILLHLALCIFLWLLGLSESSSMDSLLS